MNVEVFNSLAEIPASVAGRFSYPSLRRFFLSAEWFACLYDTALHESVSPRVYCVSDENQEAIGLLYCSSCEGGRSLRSLTNFYTMEFAPAVFGNQSAARKVVDSLAGYLRSERPRWTGVELRLLYRNATCTKILKNALESQGFAVFPFAMYQNWFLELRGRTFNEYFSLRSSRLVNTITRKEKKLKKSHEYRVDLHATHGPDLGKAVQDYVAIYNRSWKRPEPFPAFMPRLVDVTCDLGIMRLGVLYIDAKPAAAQLWITEGEKAFIYKLAYDEAFSEFSPGSILSREMFKYAIDVDEVKEIDYGVGGEGYKRDWMEEVREIEGIQAYNLSTISGAGLAALERSKRLAKRVLKRNGRQMGV